MTQCEVTHFIPQYTKRGDSVNRTIQKHIMQVLGCNQDTESFRSCLLNHEMKHLKKDYRTNRERMAEILHTDFHEIGLSGNEYHKQDILDRIPLDTPAYQIRHFQYKFTNDRVITTYHLVSDTEENRACESIWKLENQDLKLYSFSSTLL